MAERAPSGRSRPEAEVGNAEKRTLSRLKSKRSDSIESETEDSVQWVRFGGRWDGIVGKNSRLDLDHDRLVLVLYPEHHGF